MFELLNVFDAFLSGTLDDKAVSAIDAEGKITVPVAVRLFKDVRP